MSLTIESTQQVSADVYVDGTGTDRVHVAALTFSYRPSKRMGLSLEIVNEAAAVTESEAVRQQVEEFIEAAFKRAADAGLPVPTTGSE